MIPNFNDWAELLSRPRPPRTWWQRFSDNFSNAAVVITFISLVIWSIISLLIVMISFPMIALPAIVGLILLITIVAISLSIKKD